MSSLFISRTVCPVCDSQRLRQIFSCTYDRPPISDCLQWHYDLLGIKIDKDLLAGSVYTLAKCQVCGLVFQSQIPNEDLSKRLYDTWLGNVSANGIGRPDCSLALSARYFQELMQIVSYMNREPATLDFLDFGMGWGRWASMARALGVNSHGTEIARDRIEYASSAGVKIVEWDDIPRHSFDLINTEQVFEHLPDPVGTLRHLSKGLKDHGLIKISVPTSYDIERRLKLGDWRAQKNTRNSLNPVAPLEHINCYSRRSFTFLAAAADMQEISIPMRHQYRYLSDWSGPKRILKNLFLPLYRNVLKGQNYIFFRKHRTSSFT